MKLEQFGVNRSLCYEDGDVDIMGGNTHIYDYFFNDKVEKFRTLCSL